MYLITDGSTLIRTTTSTGNEPSRAGEPMDAEEALRSMLRTVSITVGSIPSMAEKKI